MSLIDLYYDYWLGMTTDSQVSKAQAIAFEILHDITDRGGVWSQEWDNFGAETQEEFLSTWVKKIQGEL